VTIFSERLRGGLFAQGLPQLSAHHLTIRSACPAMSQQSAALVHVSRTATVSVRVFVSVIVMGVYS
jgi:hypothetical protein